MKNSHGLIENADSTVPREYKLSHVLADYRKGFRTEDMITCNISVPCEDVADGKLDFVVPLRPLDVYKKSFITRIALAWEVFRRRADVLRYE